MLRRPDTGHLPRRHGSLGRRALAAVTPIGDPFRTCSLTYDRRARADWACGCGTPGGCRTPSGWNRSSVTKGWTDEDREGLTERHGGGRRHETHMGRAGAARHHHRIRDHDVRTGGARPERNPRALGHAPEEIYRRSTADGAGKGRVRALIAATPAEAAEQPRRRPHGLQCHRTAFRRAASFGLCGRVANPADSVCEPGVIGPGENHSTPPRLTGMLRDMFRYAFLAAQSAVADTPKAAVNPEAASPACATAVAAEAAAAVAAAFTAAAAPLGGARS